MDTILRFIGVVEVASIVALSPVTIRRHLRGTRYYRTPRRRGQPRKEIHHG